jgi:predicted SAM-dependent methyltransferase
VRRTVKVYRGRRNSNQIRKELQRSPRRIVIGDSATFDPGWNPTDLEALNILREADWERFFAPGSIDAMLAELVREHLTAEEAFQGAKHCHRHLKPGGYLRIAVPDGNNPDLEYIAYVKVGGCGAGAEDHKVF